MQRNPRQYLHDAREAARTIADLVRGKTLDDYEGNVQLRSAVERQFIIGEAFYQLENSATDLLNTFPNHREIIQFRHMLVHHYHRIDDKTVRGIIQDDLAQLVEQLDALLK